MKAVGKYVVITEIKEQITTGSGILLTSDDSNNLRYKKGVVNVPGTDVETVVNGDEIYYDKKSGHSMMLNSEMVSMRMERDVVIVV